MTCFKFGHVGNQTSNHKLKNKSATISVFNVISFCIIKRLKEANWFMIDLCKMSHARGDREI